ncbi:MAG: Rab family GTPase [Promethearchaeota archaeon]
MLRQIHIFFDKEHIFVKDFAKAFGSEELKTIVDTIDKYMEMPIPGKTINRKISDYQIFHRGEDKLYFLIVTDLIDSLQYFDKIMLDLIKKFKELFPEPKKIKESTESKESFLTFLNQIQKELHSKIAIIGPAYAGKTTLYNLLRSNDEKEIMDFAKSSTFDIDGLSFELWDFQLRDNFSLLWTKFISGSDLVIFIFNLANYHLKIMSHFVNMHNIESNYSKLLMIGNKRDLIEDTDLRKIKNELNTYNFEELSLNSPDARSQLITLIKGSLGLKEELPSNFEELVNKAEILENVGNSIQALAKYKELVKICTTNQNFERIKAFQEKIDHINERIKEQTELRKESVKERKFDIPVPLKFRKKVSVKPLPSSIPSIDSIAEEKIEEETPSSVEKAPQKIVSFQKLEIKPSELKVVKTSEIPPKPKKLTPIVEFKEEKPKKGVKMPLELFGDNKDLVKDVKKTGAINFTKELQQMISNKGSTLSLRLCEQLIIDLAQSLGRPLTIEDVQLAADFFVKQEQISHSE